MLITRRALIAAVIGTAAVAPAVVAAAMPRRLVYQGTRTGRWSGGVANLENVPKLKSPSVAMYPGQDYIDYWSCALTDEEIARAHSGVDPSTIRPEHYQRIRINRTNTPPPALRYMGQVRLT